MPPDLPLHIATAVAPKVPAGTMAPPAGVLAGCALVVGAVAIVRLQQRAALRQWRALLRPLLQAGRLGGGGNGMGSGAKPFLVLRLLVIQFVLYFYAENRRQ